MEPFSGTGFNTTATVTRKRSNRSRRPRQSPRRFLEGQDVSPPSSTPSSDNASKSTESGSHDASIQRKEFSLNSSSVKFSSINRLGGLTSSKRIKREDKCSGDYGAYGNGNSRPGFSGGGEHGRSRQDLKRCSEGSGAGHRGASGGSAENKLRKVKLKVGGVTHTIHAKSSLEGAGDGGPSKPPRSSDAQRNRHKLALQGKAAEGTSSKQSGKSIGLSPSEPVRKSKRVPKKRVLDGDSDEDDEIRYLERLKRFKAGADHFGDAESNQVVAINNKNSKDSKNRRIPYEVDDDFDSSRRVKDSRKMPRTDGESEDMDFLEEEEPGSDIGPESKRPNDEATDPADGKREFSLTTRQRALQSSKDGTGGNGSSLIEFPDGLPPAPPRRQKEKLSEVEQQLKKAEAAQRRRVQVEKAARESEAEAIRKILGQDSSRKKREDKLRKKREELAKEKAAKSLKLASGLVRWTMGANGTTVTFADTLPSIFSSKPCSYPPPREKCAGPSCTNPYNYRDSKSNLPLCSLQCYRAVQLNDAQVTGC